MDIDIKKVRELMSAMGKSGTHKLRLRLGETEIELERGGGSAPAAPAAPAPAAEIPQAAAPVAAPAPEEPSGTFVTSPMVGTFYSSPSPEAEVFVKAGDTISEDTVVCIIEAMKVMNEVKAGVKGVVKEMLVDNGHPVEFGTKLFRVG